METNIEQDARVCIYVYVHSMTTDMFGSVLFATHVLLLCGSQNFVGKPVKAEKCLVRTPWAIPCMETEMSHRASCVSACVFIWNLWKQQMHRGYIPCVAIFIERYVPSGMRCVCLFLCVC